MFRAIVFDLDHTLFDRYATIRKTFIAFYDQYRDRIPQQLSYEEFVEKVIEIEKVYIYYGWHTVIKELANNGLMTPMTEDEIITAVREVVVDKCWALAAVKLPFTIPTLNKLRQMGYKIGLITNGGHNPQTLKLKMLELEDMFDAVVISGDVGVHKPNPEPFMVLAEKIGIDPSEMMYVGDHPLNDVEGSRRAGYTPVWVRTTGNWYLPELERAPYEVDTVAELPELLAKIDK